MISVDEREPAMPATLPFRSGEVVEELCQSLDADVLFRRARMEPVMERLSAAFAAKDVEEFEREEEYE